MAWMGSSRAGSHGYSTASGLQKNTMGSFFPTHSVGWGALVSEHPGGPSTVQILSPTWRRQLESNRTPLSGAADLPYETASANGLRTPDLH